MLAASRIATATRDYSKANCFNMMLRVLSRMSASVHLQVLLSSEIGWHLAFKKPKRLIASRQFVDLSRRVKHFALQLDMNQANMGQD